MSAPTTQWPVNLPPTALADIQASFTRDWVALCQQAQAGKLSNPAGRRFNTPAWSNNPAAALSAHAWSLSAQSLYRMLAEAEMPEPLRARLRFTLMQWVEATCPANFLASNPDALQTLQETQGASLLAGMQNFLGDLRKGQISHTDDSAFALGDTLATCKGAVIFQNRLMQIIQYAPLTAQTYTRPLVMIPPCINKFYILDLQPENSFVRYALEQGMTVFMVSWRNPLPSDTDGIHTATWSDYLQEGVLQALDVVRHITKQTQVNALGFCVGGTMLSAALALAHTRGDDPVAALTLLTTLLDFEQPGVLGVFVDEWHAQLRDQQLAQGGLMTAHELNTTFSFLRPSELVWNYVADNYLKGQTPAPFDLLYWNGDSTNLPGPFFAWYFRHLYLHNRLREPGGVTVDGVPIDLSTLRMPCYLYGSRDDHIVPWQAAYASTALLRGSRRFVLGASGHVAGVINPPVKQRRHYWAHTSDVHADQTPPHADDWFAQAQTHPGSWWPDWAQWLTQHAGKRRRAPARQGNAQYAVIETAPGAYVRVNAR